MHEYIRMGHVHAGHICIRLPHISTWSFVPHCCLCEKRWHPRQWASWNWWENSGNGLKQLKHVPRKSHSQQAKIGALCGCWHSNLTVMRRRLHVRNATTLGDRHHWHKKMPSIIFWLWQFVTGSEKTTGTIERYPRKLSSNRPDLDRFKHNQQPMLDRAIQKCSMLTTKLRLSQIVTPFPVFEEHWDPTRWLLWQMIKAVHSTSSCSNCFVSSVRVTKTKSDEHSRWRMMVRMGRDAVSHYFQTHCLLLWNVDKNSKFSPKRDMSREHSTVSLDTDQLLVNNDGSFL